MPTDPIKESNLEFIFREGVAAIPFDATEFYKEFKNSLDGGKGVDIIAVQGHDYYLIEVKNCRGEENNNTWRIAINNRKLASTNTKTNTEGRESLDIEVPKKVAETLACLMGANSKRHIQPCAEELKPFFDNLVKKFENSNSTPLKIVLFLEGDFSTKSRRNDIVLKEITDSMKKRLRWLNAKVFVDNTNHHNLGKICSSINTIT